MSEYPRKSIMCLNCGRIGHENKSCREPKSSFGIINLKINIPEKYRNFLLAQFAVPCQPVLKVKSRVHPDVQCYISDGVKITQELYHDTDQPEANSKITLNDDSVYISLSSPIKFHFFQMFQYNIQFMMVSRKYSLAIIDFLKGKYNPNDTKELLSYFQNMMQSEIDMIKIMEYDDLVFKVMNRDNLPKEEFLNQLYNGNHGIDYSYAKKNFNRLKYPDEKIGNEEDCGIRWSLNFYTSLVPKWSEPEWGFPKGKRIGKTESNIECAVREFVEETCFDKNEFIPMNNLEPLIEYLTGTDNIPYRHVYFLAYHNAPESKSLNIDYYETGEIKFFYLEEALKKIRPYHTNKKHILIAVYTFFMNYLINLSRYVIK